jgi:two-component system response regulator FixJ
MNQADLSPVHVFLVDDEPDVTDALTWLLDSVRIRSSAYARPSEFIAAVRRHDGPCCAAIDLRMPEMTGLELQRFLLDQGLPIPLIFLTAHGDVPAAVNAMQAGALDFVQKPFNPNHFLESIRKAMRMALQQYEERQQQRTMAELLRQLSAREIDVLRGVHEGLTSKLIAKKLQISPKTVDVHRANIMRKMGVGTSVELVQRIGRQFPL